MFKAFYEPSFNLDKESWRKAFEDKSSSNEIAELLDDKDWKLSIAQLENLRTSTDEKSNNLINMEIAKGDKAKLSILKMLIEDLSNFSELSL